MSTKIGQKVLVMTKIPNWFKCISKETVLKQENIYLA